CMKYISLRPVDTDMAWTESDVVSTSGFNVRPLSRVAKRGDQKPEGRQPAADGPSNSQSAKSEIKTSRLRQLTNEHRELEAKLRLGGGGERIEKQHQQGKLTARERIDLLLDKGCYQQEIGLLVAYDQYQRVEKGTAEGGKGEEKTGAAPAAGVVTTIGHVAGREVVVVANDATVKAGSWWPETIKKILRAQEIAMRSRVPIIYLVDSAGVNLPYQGGVFPGQYGASRIFYY